MKQLSTIFTLFSGVFAVLPGVAILLTNIGVPPNSSKNLFAGIIEALGVLTLMLLWMNKERIARQSLKRFNRNIILSIVFFLLSLFSYLFLFGYQVEEVPNSNALFFPFWAEGELKKGLNEFGSRAELIRQWGRDDVFKVMNESSKIPLLVTTLIMLFVYQLVFVSLTYCFGVIGIRLSKKAKSAMAKKKSRKKADLNKEL